MAANVEWMFSGNNVTPWHGIGEIIKGTLSSEEAIKVARLDWDVVPKPIYDEFGREIPGFKVNQRSSDHKNLGIVTSKYKIVQNSEAFGFTDELLGEGVQYESAGSLASGKRVWLLASRKRNEILTIYYDKPDLRETEHTAFRFVNAVSDYATHTTDHKNTRNYRENLFMKTVDGNNLIDTAYLIAKVA